MYILCFAYDARPRFPFHRVRILREYRETDVYAMGIAMEEKRRKKKKEIKRIEGVRFYNESG